MIGETGALDFRGRDLYEYIKTVGMLVHSVLPHVQWCPQFPLQSFLYDVTVSSSNNLTALNDIMNNYM